MFRSVYTENLCKLKISPGFMQIDVPAYTKNWRLISLFYLVNKC